ncbi:hypothetical protein Tco_0619617 [Tanacetum coccineum]
MKGFINEDDNESRDEQKRRWNIYTNYDDAYEINHEHNKGEELCEIHELPVCNIKRYMMIKYSFNDDEEYVTVKEDEYDDLTEKRHAELTKKSFGLWTKDRRRQPRLLFNFVIESVFPDINTAYLLHTIRRIDRLDVISLYFIAL